MVVHVAKPEHEVAYEDLIKLIDKHRPALSPVELLAVAANLVGKLVALQDQRTMTVPRAMAIVTHNLEIGNKQTLKLLIDTPAAGKA